MSTKESNQVQSSSTNSRLRSGSTNQSPIQVLNQKQTNTTKKPTTVTNKPQHKNKDSEQTNMNCCDCNKPCLPDNIMDFLKAQFQDVKDGIAENGEKLESIKSEFEGRFSQIEEKTDQMSNDLMTLTVKCNQLEQSIKNYSLEIVGVPGNKDENLVNVITKIGETMNVKLNENDIDNVFRVKTANKKNSSEKIIVNFVRVLKKQEFLDKRKIKKSIYARELGYNSTSQIYIAESLTKDNNYLSYLARDLVKRKLLFRTWHAGGKIYVKISENSNPKKITTASELELLNLSQDG